MSIIKTTKRNCYLYGMTDDKYVRENEMETKVFPTSRFKMLPEFEGNSIGIHSPPIRFMRSPDTLVVLTEKVVDSIPIPNPFSWSNFEVVTWIAEIGFPQYRNTFRVNLINGRTLLLLEASQLVAMNITDFSHIQKITSGIRRLLYYEIAFFSRSISQPPKPLNSLNKDFRVRAALSNEYDFRKVEKYENSRPSDLFRSMKIIRPLPLYKQHWQLLEDKLAHTKDVTELIAEMWCPKLYKNHYTPLKLTPKIEENECNCLPPPPCVCQWTTKELEGPRKIKYGCAGVCGIPSTKCEGQFPKVLSILVEINLRKYSLHVTELTYVLARLNYIRSLIKHGHGTWHNTRTSRTSRTSMSAMRTSMSVMRSSTSVLRSSTSVMRSSMSVMRSSMSVNKN